MKHFTSSLLATFTLSLGLTAQTLEEGYESTVQTLPGGAQAIYDLPGPGVIYYDGTALVIDDGTTTTPVLTFINPPSFASFTIPAGPSAVIFGESSNGEIWYVPLDGTGSPRLLTTLTFNFDAVLLSSSTMLVSAKTGGFGVPDNDVIAVDLATGATDQIATVPGFSGPLAIDAQGDVYYGIPRGGSADVLRFSAAQIAGAFGPGHLVEANATVVHPGLPSALDMVIDDDGDIFVSDFVGPSLIEISRDPTVTGTRETQLVSYTFGIPSAGSLSYSSAPDEAAFEPFQPAFGKVLTVIESQYGGGSQIRTIRPARPVLTVTPNSGTIPTGAFTLQATGGAANGLGVLLISLSSNGSAPFTLPGFEQPVFLELGALSGILDISLDANGSIVFPFLNPGLGTPTDITWQVVFVGSGTGHGVLGASNALTTTFGS